jgi:hypothetical protein
MRSPLGTFVDSCGLVECRRPQERPGADYLNPQKNPIPVEIENDVSGGLRSAPWPPTPAPSPDGDLLDCFTGGHLGQPEIRRVGHTVEPQIHRASGSPIRPRCESAAESLIGPSTPMMGNPERPQLVVAAGWEFMGPMAS